MGKMKDVERSETSKKAKKKASPLQLLILAKWRAKMKGDSGEVEKLEKQIEQMKAKQNKGISVSKK